MNKRLEFINLVADMTTTWPVCKSWIIVAGLFCLTVPSASAEQAMPPSVLIMDDSGGAAAGPFYPAIVSGLCNSVNRDPSNQYSIYVESLDFHRFHGPEYELSLKQFFVTKYKGHPIEVIVAVGFGALQYVLRSREELWPAVPVVFTFIDPQLLKTLPADVTGTTFRLKLADMVTAARVVVSHLDRIALVGDPLKSLVPYQHFQDEILTVAATGLQIIDLTGMPMREVRVRVASLPERSAILYPGMYSDGEGTYLTPVEGLKRFADVANRPIIVTAETQVGPGIGGYIAVPSAIGQGAAVQVLRILGGERPAAIPVSEGNFVKPVFDWRQLQRLGIKESALPPGSEVRFREPSLWELYREQILAILAVLLMQSGLISWLVFEHRRRQLAEIQSRNVMSELAYMNRRAAAGELSASIAHEVNQPLTGISTRASAALRWLRAEKPNLEKVGTSLEQIIAATHRAADIVASVRSMFKRETSQRLPVDINELIRAVLAIARTDLLKNGVELHTDLDERTLIVEGDQVQLQQVILNLIMNGIEAMQSVRARRLMVKTGQRESRTVYVSVEDTGTGIDPANLDRVFSAMFTTKEHGMGMGLSICHSIIESHAGRIWVTPAVAGGSNFQFELPVKEV